MENRNQSPSSHYGNNWPEHRGGSSGKVLAGLLLIAVGVVVLASKLHIFFLPGWMFSWQMLLIVIGLFVGFRQNFRKSGWLVLVLIGTVFLINDLVAGFNLRIYFWPILLIGIGLWVMLKPRNRFDHRFAPPAPGGEAPHQPYSTHQPDSNQSGHGAYSNAYTDTAYSTEDMVDATAILGGIKKNIVSKNFLGGEVVSVFGGTELNLSQADIQHPVILEATQIFGGTTLIIPPHWQVKSEMVAILGGIDDKRPMLPDGYDPNKVLILKGTTLFGGLNIKSY